MAPELKSSSRADLKAAPFDLRLEKGPASNWSGQLEYQRAWVEKRLATATDEKEREALSAIRTSLTHAIDFVKVHGEKNLARPAEGKEFQRLRSAVLDSYQTAVDSGVIEKDVLQSYRFIERTLGAKSEYDALRFRPLQSRILPEYVERLRGVGVFIDDAQNVIAKTQIEMIRGFPPDTQVTAFVDKSKRAEIESSLKEKLPADVFQRLRIVEVSPDSIKPWAQDYSDGDSRTRVLPPFYMRNGKEGFFYAVPNEFLAEHSGATVRRVPYYFGGGNVFVARDRFNKDVVLAGAGDLPFAEAQMRQIGFKAPSATEYKAALQKAFGVTSVELVGVPAQSGKALVQAELLYHLDLSLIPIRDGVIAMAKMLPAERVDRKGIEERYDEAFNAFAAKWESQLGSHIKDERDNFPEPLKIKSFRLPGDTPPEVRERVIKELKADLDALNAISRPAYDEERLDDAERYLQGIRSSLAKRFKIVDIPVTRENVAKYQSYTNGIVFKDAATGKPTYMMPIYPNEKGEHELSGLNLENKRRFESLGFTVIPVKDWAHEEHGNIHCLSTRLPK